MAFGDLQWGWGLPGPSVIWGLWCENCLNHKMATLPQLLGAQTLNGLGIRDTMKKKRNEICPSLNVLNTQEGKFLLAVSSLRNTVETPLFNFVETGNVEGPPKTWLDVLWAQGPVHTRRRPPHRTQQKKLPMRCILCCKKYFLWGFTPKFVLCVEHLHSWKSLCKFVRSNKVNIARALWVDISSEISVCCFARSDIRSWQLELCWRRHACMLKELCWWRHACMLKALVDCAILIRCYLIYIPL